MEDAGSDVWNQVRQHAEKNFAEAKSLFEAVDSLHRKLELSKNQSEVSKLNYLRQLNIMTRYASSLHSR
jgi:hypothetical protein